MQRWLHWRSTLSAGHILLEISRFRSAIYRRCGHFFLFILVFLSQFSLGYNLQKQSKYFQIFAMIAASYPKLKETSCVYNPQRNNPHPYLISCRGQHPPGLSSRICAIKRVFDPHERQIGWLINLLNTWLGVHRFKKGIWLLSIHYIITILIRAHTHTHTHTHIHTRTHTHTHTNTPTPA